MNNKLGQPVKNKNKVPQRLWRKFSNHGKKVFNNVFHSMRPSLQWSFKHPDAAIESRLHWDTTRYNAAVSAAWAADGNRPIDKVENVKKKRRV